MATDKRSYNDTISWEYFFIKLKYITCNVLSVLLFIAAFIMLKCSKLFDTLSEYLNTIVNSSDLSEVPLVNRCNCSLNHNNKSKNILDENQVVDDSVKETLSIKYNDYARMDQNIQHEPQEEEINNISDTVNEKLSIKFGGDNNKNELLLKVVEAYSGNEGESSINKQYDDHVCMDHNNILRGLQEENIHNISETVNEALHLMCNDNASIVPETQHESQEEDIYNISDSPYETLNVKCNDHAFMKHNIQHNLQENIINISNENEALHLKCAVDDLINEVQLKVVEINTGSKEEAYTNNQCNDSAYMEYKTQYESQEENIYNISDNLYETSNEKCNDSTYMEHKNQHESQEENIYNISDNLYETSNEKYNDITYMEHKNQYESQEENINISDNLYETSNENASMEHKNQYESQEETINISDNSYETSNEKYNDITYMEHKNQYESQEENINISDNLYETSNENASMEHKNQYESQEENIINISDNLYETSNEKHNDITYMEHENQYESQEENINISDNLYETSNENAYMEHNIHDELQEGNIINISDNLYETSNEKRNDITYMEHKNQYESQEENIINISDNSYETSKETAYVEHNIHDESQEENIINISDSSYEISNENCNDSASMEHNYQYESLEENIINISDNSYETSNETAYMEHNIHDELQEENIYNISDDLYEASNEIAYMEHKNQHESQEKNIINISDNLYETSNENAYMEHNIHDELQENIYNISDNLYETSNEIAYMEHKNQYESQEEEIINISDSVNEALHFKCVVDDLMNDVQLKVVEINTGSKEEAYTNNQCYDSAYMEHKTEHQWQDENIYNISDNLYETSNEKCNDSAYMEHKNQYESQEEKCNDSSSMEHNFQHELQEENIYNISDCSYETLNVTQNSHIHKGTMNKKIITTVASKVEKKSRFPSRTMNFIVNTIKENEVKDKPLKIDVKLNKNVDIVSKQAIISENPHQSTEMISISTSDNVSRDKELLLLTKETMKTDSSVLAYENYGKSTYCKSMNNHKYVKNNSHESRKSINKYESSNLKEVDWDILNLTPDYSLAHCVADNLSGSVISTDIMIKFGGIDELLDQHIGIGEVGEILHDKQYIFYLITKRKSGSKSSNAYSLEKAFNNLLLKMKMYGLSKLAIPLHGMLYLPISEAKHIISRVFSESNIEIIICTAPSKIQIKRPLISKIMYTSKQLWEMEPQTDILMFIDMGKIYLDGWKDKVVENINARYQFKDRFSKDIDIKPIAPGDVWSYKIDTEILFCIFTKPEHQNPSYFKCLNKAFNVIKSEVTGYRYMGIQLEQLSSLNQNYTTNHTLVLLQSVFSQANGEIWICGDNKNTNTHKYQQYKKTVYTAIEMNKGNPTPNTKHRNKQDNSRHQINSVVHSSVKNNHNKPDDIVHLEQTTKCKTENWDDY